METINSTETELYQDKIDINSILSFIDDEETKELNQTTDNIITEEKATKMVKTYKKILKKIEENKEKAKQAQLYYKKLIERWEDKNNAPLKDRVTYLASKLEEYMREQNKNNTKLKTIHLLHGTLKLRDIKNIEYDETNIINFLRKEGYDEYLKFDLKKQDLKSACEIKNNILYLKNKPVEGTKVSIKTTFNIG